MMPEDDEVEPIEFGDDDPDDVIDASDEEDGSEKQSDQTVDDGGID